MLWAKCIVEHDMTSQEIVTKGFSEDLNKRTMWKLKEKDSLDTVAKGLSGHWEKRALWILGQIDPYKDWDEKEPIKIGTKRTLRRSRRREHCRTSLTYLGGLGAILNSNP